MKRVLRVLLTGLGLALGTYGLAAAAGVLGGFPPAVLGVCFLPLYVVGIVTDSLVLALLAQWAAFCVPALFLVGAFGGLRSEPPPGPAAPPATPDPEAKPWIPPDDDVIARALRAPLNGQTPASPPGDPAQPPPQ